MKILKYIGGLVMKINNRKKFAEVEEVSYKDKCMLVRSKIKEVIYDIQAVVIPEFKTSIKEKIEGRVVTEINQELAIHKLEYISELLVRWYNTISQDFDGVSIGGMFIHCDEDCVTTTVNSLYIFFNTFDVVHLNTAYTTFRFLSLCKRYCDCKYKHEIVGSKIFLDNECKLLYYIRMISKCYTIEEASDIYRQAIKP